MSSRKANCKWTVSFSATSQIHFIGNLVFISRDRFFTVCQASALDEVCSVALLTGSAGWPDCCLVSEACSHMSVVQLTHPLFCTSSIWQDPFCLLFFDCYSFLLLLWARFFFLFLFCVYSLATHHPTVPMTVDRWLVDAGKRTCSWSLPKMLFCRWIKCETRTRMQKKKRKKNSDSECCEIYFFSSTLLPESVLPHYSGWALRETPHVCLDQTSDRTHDRVFCSQCDRHFFVPLVLSTQSAPKQWE